MYFVLFVCTMNRILALVLAFLLVVLALTWTNPHAVVDVETYAALQGSDSLTASEKDQQGSGAVSLFTQVFGFLLDDTTEEETLDEADEDSFSEDDTEDIPEKVLDLRVYYLEDEGKGDFD